MTRTYLYWTWSMRLMPAPYILSSLSKSVVSRVGGGLSSTTRFRTGLSGVVSSSFSFSPESSSCPSDSDLSSSSTLSVRSSLLFSCGAGLGFDDFFVACFVATFVFVSGVFFSVFFFLRSLSSDRIVGGSWRGSPAKISFLALNIGTQQT